MIVLGSIIAWALIAIGALKVAMGYHVAFSFSADANFPASTSYHGTANSVKAVNEAVVIGILVKIAKEPKGNLS